jgi:nitrite reductase/ring-hydroxylating ferredoxin subunit
MADFEAVARTPELGPGEVREVEAHGETLALLNVGQTYYALAARCPEDRVNLARDGRLQGDRLECPVDHALYDVRTGRRVAGPAGPGLRTYAIEIDGNEIRVGPPRAAGRLSEEDRD